MKKEIWVDSYYFPDLYLVSNLGRVKNKNTGKYLKIWQHRGYNVVSLCYKQTQKQARLCRLVYFSFNPKTKQSLHIHHKDHNKSNDKLDNLKPIEQKVHTSMHNKISGTRPPVLFGRHHPAWKGRVVAINSITKKIDYIMSGVSDMKLYGFFPTVVYNIVNGKKSIYRNYIFKRISDDIIINIGDVYNIDLNEYLPKQKKHGKYSSQVIIAVDPNSSKIGYIFETMKSIKDSGFDLSTVYSVLRHKTYKHKKFLFKRISKDLKVKVGQIYDSSQKT